MSWPQARASRRPFHVILVGIGAAPQVADTLRDTYERLQAAGLETLWDDRDLGPGAKLTDSEFLGIPVRVVVSDRTLATEEAEIFIRATGATERVKVSGLFERVKGIVASLLDEFAG